MKLSDVLEVFDSAMESNNCPAGLGKRYLQLMRDITVTKTYPRKPGFSIRPTSGNVLPKKLNNITNPFKTEENETAFWAERPEPSDKIFLLQETKSV